MTQKIKTENISDNAVTTATINADAVTSAKVADDTIDSEHLVDGSIDTAHIGDLQVTGGKMANTTITNAKLDDDVYCEIHPYNKIPSLDNVKGVILSGSPSSVRQQDAPMPNLDGVINEIPLLGICYGAQWLIHHHGGNVEKSDTREYGRAKLRISLQSDPLLKGMSAESYFSL